MIQPISCLSPTKNKSISPNSYTFQIIYKNDIQLYHGILLKKKLQKKNILIWKNIEEKKTKDNISMQSFIQEEIQFI